MSYLGSEVEELDIEGECFLLRQLVVVNMYSEWIDNQVPTSFIFRFDKAKIKNEWMSDRLVCEK